MDYEQSYKLLPSVLQEIISEQVNVEFIEDMIKVKEDSEYIKFIIDKHPKWILDAVKQKSYSLYYVPDELLTEEICLTSVKQNGKNLGFIPEEFKTNEICLEAVKQYGYTLKIVPVKLRTPELCLLAVKQDGEALVYLPVEHQTYEIYLEAVKQNDDSIVYVLEKLQTEIVNKIYNKNFKQLSFKDLFILAFNNAVKNKKILELTYGHRIRWRKVNLQEVRYQYFHKDNIPIISFHEKDYDEAMDLLGEDYSKYKFDI